MGGYYSGNGLFTPDAFIRISTTIAPEVRGALLLLSPPLDGIDSVFLLLLVMFSYYPKSRNV